jgi:hypothetical protein
MIDPMDRPVTIEPVAPLPDGASRRPAGIAHGPGHLVVYGNAAFRAAFGADAVGVPARESMVDLPGAAFELLDLVYREGRPLARWIERPDGAWRLTAVPRRDPGDGEVFGLAFHLRARRDLPVVAHEDEGT